MSRAAVSSRPIAMVVAQLAPGGAERYVVSLSTELARQGESVVVVSSGGAMQDLLVVPHFRAPVHRRDPVSLLRAALAVRGARPALVHAGSLNAALAGQLVRRTRGVPVLLTGHGWPGREMRQVARMAAATCDRVIAVSAFLAHRLVEAGFPEDRVEVIHNGVDTAAFRPPEDRAALRRRLGLADEQVVLYLGRLEPVKGFDVLLAAWEMVAAKAPGATLLVAGDGSLRALLDRPGPGVRYLGPRADVAELLGATDLLALPSRYEGLPMSVLEALACGVPVVASDVGGVSEAVDDSVGRLVPPDDPAALAAAIVALAGSPAAASLAASGAERARREFSLERMVERTREVYRRLGHPPAGQ